LVNIILSMNILLIGEYSRLHNSLKEGLLKSGHQVSILGFGDSFKDFPVDFKLYKRWDSGLLKKIKIGVYKICGFDISSYLTYLQFKRNKSAFKDFDVVQLINENSFYCDYHFEKKILEFIFKNNQYVFLLSCGTDYVNINYCFNNPDFKSIIQPYLQGKIAAKNYGGVLKFRTRSFKKLHYYIYKNIKGVIASDLDYHLPLLGNAKYRGMIPNPINIERINFKPLLITDRIVIFLGINTEAYYKKGSDYFEEALAIISKKYPDKVEIIITRSIPYAEYIQVYDKSHILLDQTFSLDQGYNALEAMAKGKVVFTGAETIFEKYFSLQEKVVINAVADVAYLVEQLSLLIENPEEIVSMGNRARQFIEREHDYIKIAQKYLNHWKTGSSDLLSNL